MADYRVNLSLTIFLKISFVWKFLPNLAETKPISSDSSVQIFTIRSVPEGIHPNSRKSDSTNLMFYRYARDTIKCNFKNHVKTVERITTHPSSFKMIRTILFSMSMSVAKFHAIPYILYESAFSKTSLRRRDHLIFRAILLRIVCRANHRDRHIFIQFYFRAFNWSRSTLN